MPSARAIAEMPKGNSQDAVMKQEDDRPVIEPPKPICLLEVLATLAPLDDEFLSVDELGLDPVELLTRYLLAPEESHGTTIRYTKTVQAPFRFPFPLPKRAQAPFPAGRGR